MSYNKTYSETVNVFGSEPEKILVDYVDKIDKSKPVLDIGAGQGRNTFYLAGKGFHIDVIDPSLVAVQTIKNFAEDKNYSINAEQCNFQNFNSIKTYSAVLVFGLIQILDWKSIQLLIDKIDSWIIRGSTVFITAWSTKDSSFHKYSNEWSRCGKNSFTNKKGEFRTFLGENEILKLFKDNNVLHHWEGFGKKHRHGNGPVEQHARVEMVFQKGNRKN